MALEDLKGVVDSLRAELVALRLNKQKIVLAFQEQKKRVTQVAKKEQDLSYRVTRLQILIDELEVQHDASRKKTSTEFTPEAEGEDGDF